MQEIKFRTTGFILEGTKEDKENPYIYLDTNPFGIGLYLYHTSTLDRSDKNIWIYDYQLFTKEDVEYYFKKWKVTWLNEDYNLCGYWENLSTRMDKEIQPIILSKTGAIISGKDRGSYVFIQRENKGNTCIVHLSDTPNFLKKNRLMIDFRTETQEELVELFYFSQWKIEWKEDLAFDTLENLQKTQQYIHKIKPKKTGLITLGDKKGSYLLILSDRIGGGFNLYTSNSIDPDMENRKIDELWIPNFNDLVDHITHWKIQWIEQDFNLYGNWENLNTSKDKNEQNILLNKTGLITDGKDKGSYIFIERGFDLESAFIHFAESLEKSDKAKYDYWYGDYWYEDRIELVNHFKKFKWKIKWIEDKFF